MKQHVILLEIKCRDCGIRLTEFEAVEKKGRCMDCARDAAPVIAVKPRFTLRDWRKQKVVANG